MFFFFNDTATTEIYTYRHTLSLPAALPISVAPRAALRGRGRSALCGNHRCEADGIEFERGVELRRIIFDAAAGFVMADQFDALRLAVDRKSTRLNSSH